MTYEDYKNLLPDYAKDIKLNLSNLHNQFEQNGLTPSQFYGTGLAVSYALRNQNLIQLYESLVTGLNDVNLLQAVKTATTLMAMNNVYYRSIHLAEHDTLSTLPAGLRMNGMRTHGLDQNDYELFSLAVSAINGCGMCIKSHCQQLIKHGMSMPAIQTTLRVSAVLAAADQAESIG